MAKEASVASCLGRLSSFCLVPRSLRSGYPPEQFCHRWQIFSSKLGFLGNSEICHTHSSLIIEEEGVKSIILLHCLYLLWTCCPLVSSLHVRIVSVLAQSLSFQSVSTLALTVCGIPGLCCSPVSDKLETNQVTAVLCHVSYIFSVIIF